MSDERDKPADSMRRPDVILARLFSKERAFKQHVKSLSTIGLVVEAVRLLTRARKQAQEKGERYSTFASSLGVMTRPLRRLIKEHEDLE